jgi:hypothetical protein
MKIDEQMARTKHVAPENMGGAEPSECGYIWLAAGKLIVCSCSSDYLLLPN